MDAQLKRGVLTLCILMILNNEDKHGYALVKHMQSFFPESEESTLYSIIRRLNSEELTIQYLSDEQSGHSKKYYHITEKGKKFLEDGVNSWERINNIFYELGNLK